MNHILRLVGILNNKLLQQNSLAMLAICTGASADLQLGPNKHDTLVNLIAASDISIIIPVSGIRGYKAGSVPKR